MNHPYFNIDKANPKIIEINGKKYVDVTREKDFCLLTGRIRNFASGSERTCIPFENWEKLCASE